MKLVIALGEKKNKGLCVPENTEPTKNVVTLSIFSMLQEKIQNAKCLDLYAGSGDLGFTALSLGAKECTFVDNNPTAIDCIEKNSKNLSFEKSSIITENEADVFLSTFSSTKYDVIFLDPPYKLTIDNIAKKLLKCISVNGVLVYLHHKNTKVFLEGFGLSKQRFYGKTGVSIFILDF